MELRYSGHRIGQAAWFLVSVYLAVLLGDLAKESLFISMFSPNGDARNLWIALPTLVLGLLSVIESYVWLTPTKDESITGEEAAFRFLHLVIFMLSIIFQAFLAYACSTKDVPQDQRYFVWAHCLGLITLCHTVYNGVWIIKWRVVTDYDGPRPMLAAFYMMYYALFSIVFIFSHHWVPAISTSRPETIIAAAFSCYIVSYMVMWWKPWHSKAFLSTTWSLYGNARSSD